MALLSRDGLKEKAKNRFGNLSKAMSAELLTESVKSFSSNKEYDIFLSHSFLDADEVGSIKEEYEERGFSVYVDWIEDKQLERDNVNVETAKLLKSRLSNCKSLLYTFSDNSSISKWMPWELGYFDAFKGRVAILPLTNKPTDNESYKGVEFLGLYPYITKTLSVAGTELLYVNEEPDIYVTYFQWLQGHNPYKR